MLEGLLKRHTELQNEADEVVKEYASYRRTAESGLSKPEDIKVAKKEMKVLQRKYQNLRNLIYSLEDTIATMDESKLDEIVEPLNEDIDEQTWIINR